MEKQLYILREKVKEYLQKVAMQSSFDRMFDDLQFSSSRGFPGYLYHVKVSEVGNSFYVLIRKKRAKILGDSRKKLFENIKNITQCF